MSTVNADIGELLRYWNNIKTAITSVETTRTAVRYKYQQLNGVWKDKQI